MKLNMLNQQSNLSHRKRCGARLFICLLCVFTLVSCKVRYLPDSFEVSADEWILVKEKIMDLVREGSGYAKTIDKPNSVEVVFFEKRDNYFIFLLVVKTVEIKYLIRFVGGIDGDYIKLVGVGSHMESTNNSRWRIIEQSLTKGNLAPLFKSSKSRIEQLDWGSVKDCFDYGSDLYGLGCDGWMRLINYKNSSLSVVSDTSLNLISLKFIVAVEIHFHLKSRIVHQLGRDITFEPVYESRRIDFPWFSEVYIITVGKKTHQSSIIGYLGRNGISYRLAPSFIELIDTLTANPDADISTISFDRYGHAIDRWTTADSLSRMYEFYNMGPDADTMYSGEEND